jgi:hypothetical protein
MRLNSSVEVAAMKYDQRKMEEVVIALPGALEFENGRVWKRFDFAIMDALHEKGLITDPKGNHESVYLAEEGKVLAKRLAANYFAVGNGGGISLHSTPPVAQLSRATSLKITSTPAALPPSTRTQAVVSSCASARFNSTLRPSNSSMWMVGMRVSSSRVSL